MPKFSIKIMLAAVAAISLFLSTRWGYPASRDVRAIILLLIFVSTGLAAFHFRGRRRAFWLGFFATMLILGIGFPKDFVPAYFWVEASWGINYINFLTDQQRESYLFLRDLIHLLTMLSVSTAAGYIGCYIYDQRGKSDV